MFVLWPIGVGVDYSFYDANGFGFKEFIGGTNYGQVMVDQRFWAAMLRNVVFAVVVVGSTVLLGFFLAYALCLKMRGWRVFQLLQMIPYITPAVVCGLLWRFMLEPTGGLVNSALRALHLDALAGLWLTDAASALPTAAFIHVWAQTPFALLLLFSAMVSLPTEVIEAAQIDGAGHLKRMFLIVFPMMRPFILLVTLILLINNFRSFDLMYILTKGGPINSTTIAPLYVYVQGFTNSKYGYANAAGMVLGLILITIGVLPTVIRKLRARSGQGA
jgi:ABC-type sugar transport system permease subunit